MKRTTKYIKTTWAIAVCMLLFNACERRPLEEDELPRAAWIQVNIDWSKSGINPLSRSGDGVHRVSLRFFPKNGKTSVFDLYMEENVTEEKILVPVGEYSVIVFNESIDDHAYWDESITFTDVNNYNTFAANAVTFPDALRKQRFPFYQPNLNEQFIVEPLRLTSWSLDDFKVTDGMVLVSHGQQTANYLTSEEKDMIEALKKVVMRPLTHQITLTAKIENIVSISAGYASMQGFANKVHMASGLTTQAPSTYLFMLGGRQIESGSKNGTTNNRFLTFGRVSATPSYNETYNISTDILLVNGEQYKSVNPLLFDVTNQIINNEMTNVNINLAIDIKLPLVEGAIGVDDWEDEVYTLE